MPFEKITLQNSARGKMYRLKSKLMHMHNVKFLNICKISLLLLFLELIL